MISATLLSQEGQPFIPEKAEMTHLLPNWLVERIVIDDGERKIDQQSWMYLAIIGPYQFSVM